MIAVFLRLALKASALEGSPIILCVVVAGVSLWPLQKLSENRAKAVVDFLIRKGIDTSRLQFKGYGSAEPVAGNDTSNGRQLNRRTEFKIVEN